MDQQALYLAMYQECCTHGRHHEVQRTQVTTICFALVGAVLGYIVKDGHIKHDQMWLASLLIFLGLLAAVLTYKQYERFRQSMARASQYRCAIDEIGDSGCPHLRLATLRYAADTDQKKKYPLTYHVSLHAIWVMFFIAIAILGLYIVNVAKHPDPTQSGQHLGADLARRFK